METIILVQKAGISMKKQTAFSILIAAIIFLAGMSVTGGIKITPNNTETDAKDTPVSRSGFFLNTFVTITLYDGSDPALLDDAVALCETYEDIFSKTREGSELYRLNHRAPGEQTFTVSDDMAALLSKGLEYCRLSGGAFDITIEPLSSLWVFTGDAPTVPDAESISRAVEKVGWQNLRLNGNTLTFLSDKTTIDLGAIAKGYIADRIREYLTAHGVTGAIIDLGGNLLCIGQKPDGSPFSVGLKKPFAGELKTSAILSVSDMSVVTSGVYERHFVSNGKNYHHILNPANGYPYDNGLLSVTILSDTSVDGDGLSTVCFSLGLEKGLRLINSLEGIYACFIDEDYNICYSEGMDAFLSESEEG